MLHQALNAGRRGIFKGARGSFHHIGQHHQAGLFGLGLGAGVAEVIDIDRIFALELFGLIVKVMN